MNPALRSISIVAACLVAGMARAEDGAGPGARKAANATVAQGGGEDSRAGGAAIVVDDDPQGAEVPPPAPTGDERRIIGEYIRNHTPEIRDCYEKRLRDHKTLQGKLIARFDIGPNGRVIGASVEGMADRDLSMCVVKVIRGWEFEKPRSSVKLRVAYPWVFTPAPSH
jgi:outer membrane biosynthesis protein TonB